MIQKMLPCQNSKNHKFQAAYRIVETETDNAFGIVKQSIQEPVLFCERCSVRKTAEVLMLTE